MIQVTRFGVNVTATAAELDALADAFTTNHLLRLPAFFDAGLAQLIDRRLQHATFKPRLDGDLVIEDTLADDELFAVCLFVLNDPNLLSVIDRITRCGPFASFTGRVYRRGEPARAGEQYYEWHDDVSEDRRVALSVNLGPARYRGGMLQLRDARTHAAIAEAADVTYLEALLIRIREDLQHRVAPVLGPHPRTVLAGWFRGPDGSLYASNTRG